MREKRGITDGLRTILYIVAVIALFAILFMILTNKISILNFA